MENHVGGFVMVLCGREDVRLCLPIQQELDICAALDHRLQSIENILFFFVHCCTPVLLRLVRPTFLAIQRGDWLAVASHLPHSVIEPKTAGELLLLFLEASSCLREESTYTCISTRFSI